MTDLTEEDLRDLVVRYDDKTPTRPCSVCKATDWSLEACGGGSLTWACSASKPKHHGGTGEAMDWEHYRKSSHDVLTGDDRVIALVDEVKRHRAMVARLESWAEQMGTGQVGPFIAAELHNRMRGDRE